MSLGNFAFVTMSANNMNKSALATRTKVYNFALGSLAVTMSVVISALGAIL